MTHTNYTHRIRVWDLPTRIFHWLLLASIAGLYITSELEGGAMQFHFFLGYHVLALLLFRITWGVVGGHWSRFANFIPSPVTLLAYVRSLRAKALPNSVGHNPLGALSVMAMLSLLLLQVFTGFMSDDEASNTGPWTSLVPNSWVELATEYHAEIGQVLLLCLIGLHVLSVLYYKFIKHDDLITPMLNGDKNFDTEIQHSRDTWTSRLFALGIYLACSYVVYRLINIA
jgi:cytochrome b